MNNKKIRGIGAAVLVVVWLGLTFGAWFAPAKKMSDSERRPLKQWPGITVQSVLKTQFMRDFESYSLDQFPFRDGFRQIKSMAHYYGLGQKDNNGIYMTDGFAAKLDFPYNPDSVAAVTGKLTSVYDRYLKDTGSKVYASIVPDKSYYLAEKNGYPALHYEDMFRDMEQGMPWAEFVDITGLLDEDDYYRTDTHWRQENLLPAAQALSHAMGVEITAEFEPEALEKPFYGVYYGQAAIPMKPETMYLMQNDILKDCVVTNFESGKTTTVYDMEKAEGRDLYETFLSGSVSLLQVENPHADSDRELIIFRDSFGSSIAPLLIPGYKTVTLVDIRYISSAILDKFVEFHGQDVLFLYSTLVLNSNPSLK